MAPEDCTGCTICVVVCPAKDKSNPRHKSINMQPQPPLREPERENYAFFLGLPEMDRTELKVTQIKQQQVQRRIGQHHALAQRGAQHRFPLVDREGDAGSGIGDLVLLHVGSRAFAPVL